MKWLFNLGFELEDLLRNFILTYLCIFYLYSSSVHWKDLGTMINPAARARWLCWNRISHEERPGFWRNRRFLIWDRKHLRWVWDIWSYEIERKLSRYYGCVKWTQESTERGFHWPEWDNLGFSEDNNNNGLKLIKCLSHGFIMILKEKKPHKTNLSFLEDDRKAVQYLQAW